MLAAGTAADAAAARAASSWRASWWTSQRQLIAQVAGRTGRSERGGRVLVQTTSPDDESIRFAAKHDFPGFARYELEIRSELRRELRRRGRKVANATDTIFAIDLKTGEQAWERADRSRLDKGGFAAQAALKMIELRKCFGGLLQ